MPTNNCDMLQNCLAQLRLQGKQQENQRGRQQQETLYIDQHSQTTAKNSNTKMQKKKKEKSKQSGRRVQFSPTSQLHLYVLLHDQDPRELYYNDADRLEFKKEASIVLGDVRKILKAAGQNKATSANSSNSIMKPLLVLKEVNSILAEDMIGLEAFVHGTEYTRSLAERRTKIARIVVKAYHELKAEISPSETNEELNHAVATISKRLSKKPLFEALRRADYVRGLNFPTSSECYIRSSDSKTLKSTHSHRATDSNKSINSNESMIESSPTSSLVTPPTSNSTQSNEEINVDKLRQNASNIFQISTSTLTTSSKSPTRQSIVSCAGSVVLCRRAAHAA